MRVQAFWYTLGRGHDCRSAVVHPSSTSVWSACLLQSLRNCSHVLVMFPLFISGESPHFEQLSGFAVCAASKWVRGYTRSPWYGRRPVERRDNTGKTQNCLVCRKHALLAPYLLNQLRQFRRFRRRPQSTRAERRRGLQTCREMVLPSSFPQSLQHCAGGAK